jgi:hypothetical protein
MRDRLPDYDIVATPESMPIVLVGSPQRLIGRVDLHNPGESTVVLRHARLSGLAGADHDHALPTVVLRGSQARAVPLNMTVDPAIPPGEYHCELQVGGRTRPAIVHIVEDVDLTLAPQVMIVENVPDEKQHKQLIVRNDGNVVLTVGEIGRLELEDDLIWCHLGRTALGPLAEREEVDINDFITAIVKAGAEEGRRTGSLVVHNASGTVEVEPGTSAAIDLEITVPDGLHRNSRYRGITPLYTEDLVFVVVPSRRAAPDAKHEPAQRAPAKKTAKRQGGSRR